MVLSVLLVIIFVKFMVPTFLCLKCHFQVTILSFHDQSVFFIVLIRNGNLSLSSLTPFSMTYFFVPIFNFLLFLCFFSGLGSDVLPMG